jgi:hypothetical protein
MFVKGSRFYASRIAGGSAAKQESTLLVGRILSAAPELSGSAGGLKAKTDLAYIPSSPKIFGPT